MTLSAIKKHPKVLTFAFAEGLVIKKLKFLKVFQDKDRCLFLFSSKNDCFYHERLLNSKHFLSHLRKKGSVVSGS